MRAVKSLNQLAAMVLVAVLLFAAPPGTGAKTSADQVLTPRTFIDLAKEVRPAVVSIKINVETLEKLEDYRRERRVRPRAPREGIPPELEELDIPDWFKDFFRFEARPSLPKIDDDFFRYPYGAGSGMIIRSDGYILTNRHVLFHPLLVDERMFKEGQITVVLADKRKFTGDQVKLVATDRLTDLAVLKIEAENLPTVKWGDSDELEIAEWVMAVGDPLELAGSVSQGIISGIGRNIEIAGYLRLVQTTAVINPGNSGGPLVNLDGEVVGVNMAIASNTRFWQGVGFAIPSSVARRVASDLIEHGHPVRGHIGIRMTDPDDFYALAAHEGYEGEKGVGIQEVYEGYPAHEAGLRPYDILVEIDGHEVADSYAVQRLITYHNPGDEMKFKVFRGGKYLTLTVTAGEWPSEETMTAMIRPPRRQPPAKIEQKEEPEVSGQLGLVLEDYPDDPDAPDEEKGVVIRQIRPRSPAASAQPRLRVGDVILEIEKQRVRSTEQFGGIIDERVAERKKSAQKDDKALLLNVRRDDGSFWVWLPYPTD